MKENFEIFDFNLSKEDMEKISKLDSGKSLFFNHQTPETVDMMVKFMIDREGKI